MSDDVTVLRPPAAVEHAADGTALDVGRMDGRMKRLSATVTSVPFIDPKRERARA